MSAFVDRDVDIPRFGGVFVCWRCGENIDPFGGPGHYAVASGIVRVENHRYPFGVYIQRLHNSGPVGLKVGGIPSCEGVNLLRIYEYVVFGLYLSPFCLARVITDSEELPPEGNSGDAGDKEYEEKKVSAFFHHSYF